MYLRGECREIFLGFGYQHLATQQTVYEKLITDYSPDVVFALGEDETGNYQSCAVAEARLVGTNDRDQLAAIAIARCNEFGARWGINCKLFAVGNKIVWGKEEDVEFQ